MTKLRKKKSSIVARLRNYFITGVVVLVPIGITFYLTKFFSFFFLYQDLILSTVVSKILSKAS